MATITTRSGKGSPLTNTEVDDNFTNLNTDKLETSGGSVTGDISFGDNDKAIFGAGNDLQIYHDGSHSYIDEQGTGSLQIRGTNLNLKSSTNETYLYCVENGEVGLQYDNALKLATTNTGIDVTGTDATITLTGSRGTGDTHTIATAGVNSQNLNISADDSIFLRTADTINRIGIFAGGDISFYEDTGVDAKFFWDASAESLLLGSPTSWSSGHSLVVGSGGSVGGSQGALFVGKYDGTIASGNEAGRIDFGGSADETLGASISAQADATWTHSTSHPTRLLFKTTGSGSATPTERMRLDSSGRLGIATISPTTELDVSGTVTQDANLLRAIDTTIADTAVDIFVYDTRKDSDGGAWRKRTQHTSWYNETLNTATRGSRKEFPAVAVIVAESNQVTIYDGDDPTLPMWMVFNPAGSYKGSWLGRSAATCSAVAMVNGKMVVTSAPPSAYAESFWSTDFIIDSGYYLTTNVKINFNSPISHRNSPFVSLDESVQGLVNLIINDVAMTVLPNAPIDSATGLPVPTIAVATNGGVSVIKDDGTVVDIAEVAAAYVANIVDFYDERLILNHYLDGSNNEDYFAVTNIPSSDTNYLGNGGVVYNHGSIPKTVYSRTHNFTSATALGRNNFAVAAEDTIDHLILIAHNDADKTNSMVNFITSDYNTGWMNGDIKLATLSDTDDTNVTGSELVTNGTFDSDLSSWTTSNVQWTQNTNSVGGNTSGKMMYFATGTNTTRTISQSISTVTGQVYTLSFKACSDTANANFIQINGVSVVTVTDNNNASFVNHAYTFTASGSTTTITVRSTLSNRSYYDDFSVRLAEEDRSVNGNGLQVFGTVTKDPVATGADLVAYSGFSSSNRLYAPFNSDFAFGNNDYSAMLWFKDGGTNEVLINAASDATGQVWGIRIHTDNKLLTQVTDDSFSTRSIVSNTGPSVNGQGWNQVAITRTSNALNLYLNGEYLGSGSAVEANLSDPARILIGMENNNGDKSFSGSISLVRISATAPSPEQIARIYNDEKHLFTEGAQATLYGSSNSVTALAYDTDSELLHVGTSAGRSVFQGLRRVDNTTTAVTSAISASNGLVADE